MEALMFSEENGAIGWSTTIERRYFTLCFWSSKLPQSNAEQNNARVTATGV